MGHEDDDDELIFTETAEEALAGKNAPRPPRPRPPVTRNKTRPAPAERSRLQKGATGRVTKAEMSRRRALAPRRPPAPKIAQRPHCLNSAVLKEPILLSRTKRYMVGRDAAADLRIKSDRVSRRHAEIFWDGVCFVVCDRGSTNGSLLNGLALPPDQTTALYDLDRLTFGGYQVEVSVLEPGELPDTDAGGPTRSIKLR